MTTLAEKLSERKDLLREIHNLDDEIVRLAVVEEDFETDRPEVQALLDSIPSKFDQWQTITNEIIKLNNETTLVFAGEELTIQQAVTLRDRLRQEHSVLSQLSNSLENQVRVYGRRSKEEVKNKLLVDPNVLRNKVNTLAKKIRLLDNEMQKVNWTTE